jgi:hypothetical protein
LIACLLLWTFGELAVKKYLPGWVLVGEGG